MIYDPLSEAIGCSLLSEVIEFDSIFLKRTDLSEENVTKNVHLVYGRQGSQGRS